MLTKILSHFRKSEEYCVSDERNHAESENVNDEFSFDTRLAASVSRKLATYSDTGLDTLDEQ